VLPLANDPFRQALPDLGWIEGENLVIEVRSADLQFERLPALADELVRAGVELIYAPLSSAASAVQQATRTIPIVFAGTADPVAEGLVASLAHPGGNLTGLSLAIRAVASGSNCSRRWPRTTRLAVLGFSQILGTPVLESMLRAVEEGARAYDLEIRYVDQVGPEPAQLEQAFSLVLPERPDALFVVPAPTLTPLAPRIAELAIANRLPAIAADLDFPRSGLLLSYGRTTSI
jgi:putative ABC transport system substrate-binding protein